MSGHEKFYVIEGGKINENCSYDEHILIIENHKVIFQNAASRQWGEIIGESLCSHCVSAPCNPHECALIAAERTGRRAEHWKFIKGIYYRVTALPMWVGKSIYYFVSAKRTTEPYLARRLRGGGIMNKLAAIFMALILSGCAAKFDPNQAGPYPDNYKDVVRAKIERTFFDPYSLRSVRISKPEPGTFAMAQGYYVCLECNAKNRMGGYVGLKRTALLINNQEVLMDFGDWSKCDGDPHISSYEPWPEMEMAGEK